MSIQAGGFANSSFQPVALAIVRRGALWLVDRRAAAGPFGGRWEFPGGKPLPGESAEDAAVRECAEETTIQVRPVVALPPVEHAYADRRVRLHPVWCEYLAGEARPATPAVAEVRWVDANELFRLPMPRANAALLASLVGDR